jgi:hypothetical protein
VTLDYGRVFVVPLYGFKNGYVIAYTVENDKIL